jgi:REP element-mobilizing transposase RayT
MKKVIYLFLSWAWPEEWQEEPACRSHSKVIRDELTALCKRHGVRLMTLSSSLGKLHLVLGLPPRLAASRWVLLLKMSSSRRMARELGVPFRWPRDYRMCSLAPSGVAETGFRIERHDLEGTMSIPFPKEEIQGQQASKEGKPQAILAEASYK